MCLWWPGHWVNRFTNGVINEISDLYNIYVFDLILVSVWFRSLQQENENEKKKNHQQAINRYWPYTYAYETCAAQYNNRLN